MLPAVIVLVVLVLAAPGQQSGAAPALEVPAIRAGLGSCSADFTVKDAEGKPVYAAAVHVRLRYGMMSVKRMDLEVSTNSDGKALVDTLPAKGKPFVYDIQKGDRKATVQQDVTKECHGTYEVSLK